MAAPKALVVDDESHMALAAALGIERVVVGTERFSQGGMVAEYVEQRGGIGVTVECGQSGSAASVHFGESVARRMVGLMGLAPGGLGPEVHPTVRRIARFALRRRVVLGARLFRFAPGVGNFSRVRKGEAVGYYGNDPLTLDDDAVLVACDSGSRKGETLFYELEDLGSASVTPEPDRWRGGHGTGFRPL